MIRGDQRRVSCVATTTGASGCRRWLLVAVAIALMPAALGAGMGHARADEPVVDAGFDPHRMHADLLVEGGSDSAAVTGALPCRAIHLAIDDFNAAAPWSDPELDRRIPLAPLSHEGLGWNATEMLNSWLSSMGLAGHSAVETAACTLPHTDGWLVAAEPFVSLVDDQGTFLVVAVDGEVTCRFGQILLASATYRYAWSGSDGRWVYHYGANWSGSVGVGGGLSGDVEFACVDIFEPGDVAGVAEATPATQVNVDPAIRGLTGLDHWLWYEFADQRSWRIGPLTAGVESRGFTWTIETTAWIDRVMWDPDCVVGCSYRGMAAGFDSSGYEYVLDFDDSALAPAGSYDGGAGEEGRSAFEHVYEQAGDATVSTAAVWRGYYRVVGAVPGGGTSIPVAYDPVVVAGEWTMPIVSVRPELRLGP